MVEGEGGQAAPAPTGEELPLELLARYLWRALPELAQEFDPDIDAEISVAKLGQGYSNLTYALQIGEHAFVLRRPPLGANIATAHDMGREVKVLRGLARVYAYVPRVLLSCDDASVIGAPFYLMERLEGVVLRPDTLRSPLSPTLMRHLATNVVANLAHIHALDVEAAGLADLGRPAGYVMRQVQGWTKRYAAAQTDALPHLERALRWLAEHQPVASGAALIHNDYKIDNLMLDHNDLTRLVAVLDWEMSTLGDPLLDLGTTLGYWVEASDPPPLVEIFGLTALPGNPTRNEVVERYVATSECASFDPLFYYVYGLAKIGVILQQLYHRHRQGLSQDARFARLGGAVAACGLMATQAIDKRRIGELF
jgi:aminoglycoside phosphotransferase (APT) family kinase protein